MKAYTVQVDIYPNTVQGTSGCHVYTWGTFNTKREAEAQAEAINKLGFLGSAFVRRED